MAAQVYRVLVIGTGFGRRVQLPVFRDHPRFEVTAVASGHAETARAAADEFGVARYGTDWVELLAGAPVDLVSVASPVVYHRDQAVASLAAGKHLLLEKPVALDAAQAGEIREAERNGTSRAAVNHEFRYRPDVLTLKRMIEDGRLGELRGLEFRNVFPAWADPERPTFGWLSRAEMGGGMVGAVGSHNVDMMRFLTGRAVTGVRGAAWTVVPRRADADGRLQPATADDASTALVELTGGLRVRMDILASVWGDEHLVRAYGSSATVTLDGSWSLVWRGPDGSERRLDPDPDLAWTPEEADRRLPLFRRLLDRLARRLDGEEVEDLATLGEGLDVMRVLDAIRGGGR